MFIVYDNGDMKLRQGDDGKLELTGMPYEEGKTKVAYLAIQDNKRRPVGAEIQSTVMSDVVTFRFLAGLTDLLTVPANKDSEEYYYFVKLCCEADNTEDTLVLADKSVEDLNVITVLPKGVEGTLND